MIIFIVVLVIASIGYAFMHFFIASVNPNAKKDSVKWASLCFGILIFLFFGLLVLIGGEL